MLIPQNLVENIENQIYTLIFRYKIEFFAAFVIIFVGRRLIRLYYGHRFRPGTLVTSPLLYFIFSGVSLLGLNLVGLLYCSIAFFFGLIISTVFKHGVVFVRKKGVLFYKRSALISLTWTTAFVSRVYIEIFYDITQGSVISILLIFLTGLIIGEAFQIAIQKRLYESSVAEVMPEIQEK